MGSLRNRAGLVIFVIGLAIVAFLLGDIIQSGTPFWAQRQNEVGRINGEGIDYQLFNQQVDQMSMTYQQQMGGVETPQIRNFAIQQVWNQFVSKSLIDSEIEKIGLKVGKQELNDLVTGSNPSPLIYQNFTNPQTGEFDRAFLSEFINQVRSGQNQMSSQWEALLENIRTQKLTEKYSNLLQNSVYVTALEAEDEYTAKNKLANFKYVLLDYASVKDSEIKLTDADYKAYYDKNKNAFKNTEETRAIEYVLVDASPSAADTATTLANIQQLKTDLAASATDSLFASINSDTKYPVKYYSKGQISPALDSVLFHVAAGTTVGPFLSDGAYEIAKVISAKFSPDSVKASHILLNIATEGGLEPAQAKADSIKKLIEGGANFAALAVEFTQDPNGKANGGDLGTFARGQMVPAFEDAAFGGRPGEVVTATSQFGIHVIKIEKQVGNSKIVKAAIIDKVINPGKETTNAAYAKANDFFSSVSSANFAERAQEQGLRADKANTVQAMDANINGVEVPRELIRWAFEAKAGDLSDKIYENDNHFIVAKVNTINPKGIQPLEAIKSNIEGEVLNFVKARMLSEKLNNALQGANSLDQVAQKVGKSAINVENIVLANPVIPGVALENKIIGTVFGLQPNTPSKVIEGNQGVYAVQVDSFVNPKELVDSERQQQQKQMLTSKEQRAWGSIFQALQSNADIDDNRIRFY
jgi:peptidyl-prolyl cis-trans isomerase D